MAMQLEPNRTCALHNEHLEFYCKNCCRLLCASCVEEHNDLGHALRKLEKAFPLIADKCRASEEKLKQRKQTLDMQLQARTDAKKAAETNGERAVKELLNVFVRVDEIVAAAKCDALAGATVDADMQRPKYSSKPAKEAACLIQSELATFPYLLDQEDPVIAFGLWQRAEQLLENKAGALRTNKKRLPPRDHVRPFLDSLMDSLLHVRREQDDPQTISAAIPQPGYASIRGLDHILPLCLRELTINCRIKLFVTEN